jgi:crotonobetainyl-CoA:carnitine CoA-transferase CaiB-like acyl-CoA transferase
MANADALGGIRVIDFGQYIAGPMAGMLLADFGADVIRVDPPGGPRYKTAANATWNRGKRSIVLDLKKPDDLANAKRLIASADVVIENFRPGVMDRLGIGARAMTESNPRLIYCSLPGFASDDPRANVRAWEGVVGAATGCFSSHPSLGSVTRPVFTALPFSSAFAAFLGVVSIATCLLARERTGLGQAIEVPLFNATFNAFSGKLMRVLSEPEHESVARWLHVKCKDDRWLMYLPGRLNRHLLELPEMAAYRDRKLAQDEMDAAAAKLFRTRTASEWEDFCASVGLEGIACLHGKDWLYHPLAEETRIVADFDDTELGRFRGYSINPRLSETPGRVRAPRARLDAHRDEILRELQTPKPSPVAKTAAVLRGALEGIKVVDLGIILASPTCGRTLAEFGADVIKIDSTHRNPVNWHNDVNRAKRMILLDLKKPEGLDIFFKFVGDADVILENFRMGVADKLGIGYDAVRARNPGIVYSSVNAYGQPGKYSRRPGREVLAQGITGMQVRLGSEKPVLNPFNGNDYCTGLMSVYGILLALIARQRTGRGQRVDSALIYGATLLQTSVLQDYAGKQWNEPHGQDCLGTGPLYRAYQTADGWIFMAAHDCGLAHCEELSALATLPDKDLEGALEARFRERAAAHWVALLTKAGIAAEHVALKLTTLTDDPLVRAQGLAITREHAELGLVTTTGPGIKLSRTPVTAGRPAPKPGADAAELLAKIGMADDLDRLVHDGVVAVDGIKAGGAS